MHDATGHPLQKSIIIIGPLAKVFFATEITEKMSFKSFFSKISVHSVAVLSTYTKQVAKENKMESIILIILVGLAGGVAVGLQSPMASMITQRLGIFESVFIIHVGGAIIALLPLLFYGGGKLSQWRNVPWYTLGAGLFGLI